VNKQWFQANINAPYCPYGTIVHSWYYSPLWTGTDSESLNRGIVFVHHEQCILQCVYAVNFRKPVLCKNPKIQIWIWKNRSGIWKKYHPLSGIWKNVWKNSKKTFVFKKNLCSRRKHMNFICIVLDLTVVLEVGAEPKSTCTLTLHWLQDERGATLQVSLPVNHRGGQQHSALSRPYQL
jgi:hypothetical protein